MKIFNLTSFDDAEPDFSSSPVKVGNRWILPGSYVTYPGGKIARIITTAPSDKVPVAEKERQLKGDMCTKLNIFVMSSDVEEVNDVVSSACTGIPNVVQTCTAAWLSANELGMCTYLFKYKDVDSHLWLPQGRKFAYLCRYRIAVDDTIDEVPNDMLLPFSSMYEELEHDDDPPRRLWEALDSLALVIGRALRRKDPVQGSAAYAETKSPLFPLGAVEFHAIIRILQDPQLFSEEQMPMIGTADSKERGEGVILTNLRYTTRIRRTKTTKVRFQGAALQALEGVLGNTVMYGKHRRLPRKHPANVTTEDRKDYQLHEDDGVSYLRDDGIAANDGSIKSTDRLGVDIVFQDEQYGMSRAKVITRHAAGRAKHVEETRAMLEANTEADANATISETVRAATSATSDARVRKRRRFRYKEDMFQIDEVEGDKVTATNMNDKGQRDFQVTEVEPLVAEYYQSRLGKN